MINYDHKTFNYPVGFMMATRNGSVKSYVYLLYPGIHAHNIMWAVIHAIYCNDTIDFQCNYIWFICLELLGCAVYATDVTH